MAESRHIGDDTNLPSSTSRSSQSWEPMRLRPVGRVTDIVLAGMGKLSGSGGDPGDPRKQKGTVG